MLIKSILPYASSFHFIFPFQTTATSTFVAWVRGWVGGIALNAVSHGKYGATSDGYGAVLHQA